VATSYNKTHISFSFEAKATLSDATAGGIEREGNITFEICKKYAAELIHTCMEKY
jgi:threonine dehydratase